MDKLPAASSAMQWSIDLDRALRSRHPATRLRAVDAVAPRLRELGASPPAAVPPAVASALGVLPSEPRLFAHTILLRLATHFATADNAVRARILRALLLLGLDGSLPMTMACVAAEPQHQVAVLARVKAAYDAGCPRARALALRMFGCLAHLAHHSLHLRSLILSTFSSSNAPQVGKQIVLGTLEDNFKADMLLSLSRLASKSVVLFCNQVELLLLFLEHESSHCMKTVSLKCLCFMFHGSICHFPVLKTVFGTLLQLIDDDDFPLDCKRDAFMVLQKIVCGKAPIVHLVNTCELSKLVLAAESSLHSSSWEMQGSSLTYNGCQGITSNFLSTVENAEDKFVHKIVTSMVNHNISLVNQIISTGNKETIRKHTYMSSEFKMYRSMLSSMLKLLVCYPSAAAVALDKLRCLIKELARLDDSDCSEVSVANVESFQTNSAREVLDTSNDIVKPVSASMKASHMGTDFDKLKFDPAEFSSKKEVSIVHNIILWTLKFANSCHNMLSKTPGASCNLYDSIKELIECVQQNTSLYCSTYESFHLIVCGKAPIVHLVNTCELSKLVLAAESSLHSSSWEMQGTALKVIAGTLCFLQQTRSHQNMITQEGSSLTYNGCQGITSNFLSTVENAEDKFVHKIVTSMVNHNISLVNQIISTGNKETIRKHTYMSSEFKMYRSMLSSMLKLLVCYPSAAAVALDKLRCLIKELARLDDSDCSEVSVANVESFQTNSAREVLDTSNDIVKPVSASMKASHMGTDFDKLKFDPAEFSSKKEVSIVHNIILWTLKFANSCHNMLSKTPGASCNLYDSIKELIECVQQNTSLYCSTYESFHLELCAIRITKMLFRNQRYWDAYRSAMYCCREGLWFAASSVFRKLADDFGSGSFSFWFKSLLLISAGEIEMKLLLFPSAIIKLVNELKTDCDLHENFYWVETNVDSSLADSSELHGSQAKITDICSRTFLATDPLLSNTSSSHELFFQRWFISLRASFLEILADFLGILTADLTDQRDESHHDAIGDHSSVPREHNNSQLLALVHSSVEPCRLPERFSHASVVQDLHERVDRTDSQIVSQLQQLMPICCDEVHPIQIVTRMNCSGILEKDSYRLCKFAVAYLLRLRGDTRGIATGEDSVSPLHEGMQFLSNILQRVMELPFVLPKYFFRVRPCFGAELHLYDSNPENRDGISVPSGFQLSLTLCLQWKCVLERSDIDISKLYCVLAASSASSCLDVTGTRSKQFEIRKKTAGMVGLNTKLMQFVQDDLGKKREKKRRKKVHVEQKDMVTAFARFEASDSGVGFSSCLLDVSEFPQGSYKMKWHACCIDKDGAYYSLLPLNDGAAFSVRSSPMQ
uniref:Integrator complex subunit 7-like C-terminal domain-containing protein n=1 Tax=Oryza glumipatula TaxID=40148 RepID=A0A0D9Y4D3_9ORYZ